MFCEVQEGKGCGWGTTYFLCVKGMDVGYNRGLVPFPGFAEDFETVGLEIRIYFACCAIAGFENILQPYTPLGIRTLFPLARHFTNFHISTQNLSR